MLFFTIHYTLCHTMPLFAAKPKSTHVQKTLYELKDADEIRHLAIGAGARVVDLVNAKTGAVHDTVPTIMYAIKTSTTRKTSVWGMVANVAGSYLMLESIVLSAKMALPETFSRDTRVSSPAILRHLRNEPKEVRDLVKQMAPTCVDSLRYFWRRGEFVERHIVRIRANLDHRRKTETIHLPDIVYRSPESTTLLQTVLALVLLTRPTRVPFQRRLPSNLTAALVTMNQQSALDDRAFVEVTALADATPGSHPPPLDYALTKDCLASKYPSLHRLFCDFVPPKRSASSSKKVSVPPLSPANHPTLCALRAALLRQRTVPVRPIHLFRTNSLPRESVAEIALAIAMHWRYRDMPYHAYRGALRLASRAGALTASVARGVASSLATTKSSATKRRSKSSAATTKPTVTKPATTKPTVTKRRVKPSATTKPSETKPRATRRKAR